MNIFIDKETKLRVNINAPYKQFSRLDTPEIREAAGVIELACPYTPYNPDEAIFNELDHPPYFALTPRDPGQVARAKASRAKDVAQKYLDDTQYLFGMDRYKRLLRDEPEREAELDTKREEAREVIRAYKAQYPEGVM